MVLVGGGHAHLELIRSAPRFARAGIQLALVDPGDFHYSGGASAVLGGSIAPGDNQIDLADLCRRWGVNHHRARVSSVDLASGLVRLDDGASLSFDRLSLNTGSRCRHDGISKLTGAVEAKPIEDLEGFCACLTEASVRRSQRVLVIGGGASGAELAGNLLRLSQALPHPLDVTLVSSSPSLIKSAGARAGRIAADALTSRGASLCLGDRLVEVQGANDAIMASGRMLAFDHILLATGLVGSAGIHGLPSDRQAGFWVDATLQMPVDRRVFAVGDCASMIDHPRPKLGVYGVRAAPILRHNLIASLTGKPLKRYRPQTQALSILDLGDETGLAIYGCLVLRGRAMLWWKRRIDRRFLARYRAT